MNANKKKSSSKGIRTSPEIIDLLATSPSTDSFFDRVRALELSPDLVQKISRQDNLLAGSTFFRGSDVLTLHDERELSSEVLRYRHRFAEQLLCAQKFRQAALTVIQNIYLFNNRKIFFGTTASSTEDERQEALRLFSENPCRTSLPLINTFQHLIIARIWNLLVSQSSSELRLCDQDFLALHNTVEKLNTLRNIYMLLTTGLVRRLAGKTNALYKESITYKDAVQIGKIGIARAAYRYHPSCGVRFSTYAANWVFREIQRQALGGRLIRISTNIVERYCKAAKEEEPENLNKYSTIIGNSTTIGCERIDEYQVVASSELSSSEASPEREFEAAQLRDILPQIIGRVLSEKSGDIIRRRFGLPPYQGKEQSVISICEVYGVTRGSIYQLEKTALKKLDRHLRHFIGFPWPSKDTKQDPRENSDLTRVWRDETTDRVFKADYAQE